MFDANQNQLMVQIQDMNLNKKGKKNKQDVGKNGGYKTQKSSKGETNVNIYSNMVNQNDSKQGLDDVDMKQDIHIQSLSQKKIQDEFDQSLQLLETNIKTITNRVINVQESLNKRNNKLVSDVTCIIHEVLHETAEVANDATLLAGSTIGDKSTIH